jgi:HK97 family phage portal protein
MSDWVYMVMVSLLLRGNAYGRMLSRDAHGYPTQVELINPDCVRVERDRDSGAVQYKVNGVSVPAQDIFHARAYRMPGLDVGLAPITNAALTINRDRAIQQFALGYFQDAPHPAQVLTSDQPINSEQARTIKERLIAAVTGREPLVLGAGLKLATLSVSPEESQFLATQKYGAAEICRFFGVPPQKIAAADVGSSMTYSNVESAGIDLLVYTIQWWLTNLENSLFPLMPGQKHVRFDPSVLLRTDFETQMKASAIGIASKQLTPDEARAMRDQPPLTDEQKALLALVPLDVGPTGSPKPLPAAAADQAVSTEIDPSEGAPA